MQGEIGKIGTAAGAGAIIGGILGGVKGAIAGILIGGGGIVAATPGKDVELEPGDASCACGSISRRRSTCPRVVTDVRQPQRH